MKSDSERKSRQDNSLSSSKGHFLLVSKSDVDGIEDKLRPSDVQVYHPETHIAGFYVESKLRPSGIPSFQPAGSKTAGISATGLFSGENKNTPLSLFKPHLNTGFVMNPYRVEARQGDFAASYSGGLTLKEKLKEAVDGEKHWYHLADGQITIDGKTKYPGKPVFFRVMQYAANQMRIRNVERHDGADKRIKTKVFYSKGNMAAFGRRLWERVNTKKEKYADGKWAMESKLSYNEVICFKREGVENPIAGLAWFGKDPDQPKDSEWKAHVTSVKKRYLQLLKDYKHLELYFYEVKANKNIVRVMENDQAIAFLGSKKSMESGFKKATPFTGFPEQPHLLPKHVVSLVESAEDYLLDPTDQEPDFVTAFLNAYSEKCEAYNQLTAKERTVGFLELVDLYYSNDSSVEVGFLGACFSVILPNESQEMYRERAKAKCIESASAEPTGALPDSAGALPDSAVSDAALPAGGVKQEKSKPVTRKRDSIALIVGAVAGYAATLGGGAAAGLVLFNMVPMMTSTAAWAFVGLAVVGLAAGIITTMALTKRAKSQSLFGSGESSAGSSNDTSFQKQ